MSPPDTEDLGALVREGDQKIAGEIVAMRTRLIEFGDTLAEIRERIGMAPASRAKPKPEPQKPEPLTKSQTHSKSQPVVSEADAKQIESLRVPLVDLTRRLEQAMDAVRDAEAFRNELSKEGEAIGERVGARAERSFRRLEEAFAAMRMQLDSLAQAVRSRPEAEFAASVHAQITELVTGLRRDIVVEVTKELEELREPVRALREHATALRQISGLGELAGDLAAVSRHLEAIEARVGTLDGGATGGDPALIEHIVAAAETRIVAAMDARFGALQLPQHDFLGSFGEPIDESDALPAARRIFRRRRRDETNVTNEE